MAENYIEQAADSDVILQADGGKILAVDSTPDVEVAIGATFKMWSPYGVDMLRAGG